jgi:hypothetical protein
MICGTVHTFASNARVRVSRFICYRVAAGTPLPLLAVGMAIARIDHTMGDDLPIVAQVRF